jgi:hypothetical protein
MGVESKATLLAPRTCGRPEQQFSAGYELNRQMTVAYRRMQISLSGWVLLNRTENHIRIEKECFHVAWRKTLRTLIAKAPRSSG